jgi:hypothetical protein
LSRSPAWIAAPNDERKSQELDVDTLARNVKDFLRKVEKILAAAPTTTAGFTLTEFEVAAEVSASGRLGLLGTGIDASGKGGLKFKFQKK